MTAELRKGPDETELDEGEVRSRGILFEEAGEEIGGLAVLAGLVVGVGDGGLGLANELLIMLELVDLEA